MDSSEPSPQLFFDQCIHLPDPHSLPDVDLHGFDMLSNRLGRRLWPLLSSTWCFRFKPIALKIDQDFKKSKIFSTGSIHGFDLFSLATDFSLGVFQPSFRFKRSQYDNMLVALERKAKNGRIKDEKMGRTNMIHMIKRT